MSKNSPKAIKYTYNESENVYQMISINGENSLVGIITDEIPEGFIEELIGVKHELSEIHQWSARMARTYQISMFGIDFNVIKLSNEYNDYQIFPSKERKEELIRERKLDLLVGPKVKIF